MSPEAPPKLRVGFLVNPVAGLGGPRAWKGTDDEQAVAALVATRGWDEDVHAFARGAACVRGLEARRHVLVTPPGVMGEDVVKHATKFGGPIFEIVRVPNWSKRFGETRRDDTAVFARRLREARVDLLLFVGGDGTAVDVAQAVGADVPLLGVPAGVKMFSAVFARTPELAALLLNDLRRGFSTHPVDVLDLDEASYREGAWRVRSQATARVPEGDAIQAGKGAVVTRETEALQDLVQWFRDHERPGVAYVLGSGTTLGGIKEALGGGTPLGVDVWRDGAWVACDAAEEELLAALGETGEAEIIVSPTGLQGAVLGRGTAQISPAVLERVGVDRVVIVATPGKLMGLPSLFVDTGDPDLDEAFPAYVKVRTDPVTEKVFALARGVAPRPP